MNKKAPEIIDVNEKDIFDFFKSIIPYILRFFAIVFVGILGEYIFSISSFSGLMSSIGLATCLIIKELKNQKNNGVALRWTLFELIDPYYHEDDSLERN